jgi:hypothetical protein
MNYEIVRVLRNVLSRICSGYHTTLGIVNMSSRETKTRNYVRIPICLPYYIFGVLSIISN